MSLLLDALKRAADDKQKASQGEAAEPASITASVPESGSLDNAAVEDVVTPSNLTLLDSILLI